MMNTFAEMSHNGIAIPVTQVISSDTDRFFVSCFVRLAWLKVYSGNVLYFQVLLGLCSFFTIALGGLLIGVIYGLITALVTKTTTEGKHYKLMTRAYRNFITSKV